LWSIFTMIQKFAWKINFTISLYAGR